MHIAPICAVRLQAENHLEWNGLDRCGSSINTAGDAALQAWRIYECRIDAIRDALGFMTSSTGRCAGAGCSLQHLPPELLGHIFSFLSVSNKAQVSATSLSGRLNRLRGSMRPSCSEVLRSKMVWHDADHLHTLALEPAC